MKLLKIKLEMHVLIGAFESTLELLGFNYLYVNTELGLRQSSYCIFLSDHKLSKAHEAVGLKPRAVPRLVDV